MIAHTFTSAQPYADSCWCGVSYCCLSFQLTHVLNSVLCWVLFNFPKLTKGPEALNLALPSGNEITIHSS